MLALIVHTAPKPPLSRGATLVPLSRWDDAQIPLRMLRDEAKRSGRAPSPYVTLVKVPDTLRVAIITGQPDGPPPEAEFFELVQLPEEKQRLIRESFEHFRNPGSSELSLGWLARMVLGEKMPSGSVKWTKDFRLLQNGDRNASTKRT